MFLKEIFTGKIPVFHQKMLFWMLLLIIIAGGVAALIYATPYGPGLINDSVVYIGGAENILAGNGYSRTSGGGEIKPITVNAPLYSYTQAGIAGFGIDLVKAGWLVSIICYAFNVFLSAVLLQRLSGSKLWSLIGTSLIAISDSVIRAHSFALSEPLFITWMLLSLILLTYSIERSAIIFVCVAGVVVSLSYLTRYIGFSLLATGLIGLVVFSLTWSERWKKTGLFLLFSLAGGIAWGLRNTLISGNPANRSLLFHPLTADKLQEGTRTFLSFLLPDRFNVYDIAPAVWDTLAVLSLFGMIGLVIIFWKTSFENNNSTRQNQSRFAFLVALQVVLYMAVLFVSLTFFDASTALENRILVPAFTGMILIFITLLSRFWKSGQAWKQWVALFLAGVAVLSFMYDGRRVIIDLSQDGQGYASAYYRNSQTIDALKRMPETEIWTNRVPAVNILAGRPAYALLAPIDPLTRLKRPNYDSSLNAIRQSVLDGKSMLVVFEAKQVLEDSVEGEWLRDLTAGIPVVFESEDGMIFSRQAK